MPRPPNKRPPIKRSNHAFTLYIPPLLYARIEKMRQQMLVPPSKTKLILYLLETALNTHQQATQATDTSHPRPANPKVTSLKGPSP